jgi:hypothetical protein
MASYTTTSLLLCDDNGPIVQWAKVDSWQESICEVWFTRPNSTVNVQPVGPIKDCAPTPVIEGPAILRDYEQLCFSNDGGVTKKRGFVVFKYEDDDDFIGSMYVDINGVVLGAGYVEVPCSVDAPPVKIYYPKELCAWIQSATLGTAAYVAGNKPNAKVHGVYQFDPVTGIEIKIGTFKDAGGNALPADAIVTVLECTECCGDAPALEVDGIVGRFTYTSAVTTPRVQSITFLNVGTTAGTVQGQPLLPNETITFDGYFNPVTNKMIKVPSIAVVGSATALIRTAYTI